MEELLKMEYKRSGNKNSEVTIDTRWSISVGSGRAGALQEKVHFYELAPAGLHLQETDSHRKKLTIKGVEEIERYEVVVGK